MAVCEREEGWMMARAQSILEALPVPSLGVTRPRSSHVADLGVSVTLA